MLDTILNLVFFCISHGNAVSKGASFVLLCMYHQFENILSKKQVRICPAFQKIEGRGLINSWLIFSVSVQPFKN